MASQSIPATSSSIKPPFAINPPLLNSASPWATSYEELLALYNSPHTGAVTTRTSLWKSFQHESWTHQYTFFSSTTGHATLKANPLANDVSNNETSSLNTLGYSFLPFTTYIDMILRMSKFGRLKRRPAKPFIVSVTGDVSQVAAAYTHIVESQVKHRARYNIDHSDLEFMMEINLSCPNIPGSPPPAYDGSALGNYITAIAEAKQLLSHEKQLDIHVGIKTPPYTHAGQFAMLISCLEASASLKGGCPISFITATNTLGSCLLLSPNGMPTLNSGDGSGIGGLAGDALHPLALGNVSTIRKMLDASKYEDVKIIVVIGVGGVRDHAGFQRMRGVGAMAVSVGTGLGREGLQIFEKILNGAEEK